MMTMGVNWWMRSLTSHQMSLVKITGHNEKSNKFTKITNTVKQEFNLTVVDKIHYSRSRGFVKRSSSEKQRWFKTKLINSKKTLRIQKTFIPFSRKKNINTIQYGPWLLELFFFNHSTIPIFLPWTRNTHGLDLTLFFFMEPFQSQGVMNRVLGKLQHQ